MKLTRINPDSLTAKQREAYHFQKVSAILADYGYQTIKLSDDWCGADFIAQHLDGLSFIKVQLKGRLTVEKKYEKKDLWMCFPSEGAWYLYPHDDILGKLLNEKRKSISSTYSGGGYSFPYLTKELKSMLTKYKI